jgi:hypothetical protein
MAISTWKSRGKREVINFEEGKASMMTDQCEAGDEHVDSLNRCNQLACSGAKRPKEIQREV